MNIYLSRAYLPHGTFGMLQAGGIEIPTIERPWKDNAPNKSCIPEGVYKLDPYVSPKFGKCWIIHGGSVSKFKDPSYTRYGILLHPANTVDELEGCIAPGMRFGTLGTNRWAVQQSRNAMEALRAELGDEYHSLIVETKMGGLL